MLGWEGGGQEAPQGLQQAVKQLSREFRQKAGAGGRQVEEMVTLA